MVENCERCEAGGNEVRIFDAIFDGRMISICERCSIVENVPLIKKPDTNQLKESEKGIGVYDRMRRISGIRPVEKPETFFQEDRLRELNNNPELELPEKQSLNLIDHFHWDVMKNRRRKGLSQRQLAEAIGESELAIQLVEKSKLPENVEPIINKLEQFFQIKLRKMPEQDIVQKQEPVLLNKQGQELDIIPEEEMVFIDDPVEEESTVEPEPTTKPIDLQMEDIKDLDLKKINQEKVTIGDLQNLHKKRELVTKQEMVEEQKKIEERQRILLALRERDRIKLEERRRQELIEKQEAEQQRRKIIEEKQRDLKDQKRREYQDIDSFLGGTELLDEENKEKPETQDKNNIEEFDDELI